MIQATIITYLAMLLIALAIMKRGWLYLMALRNAKGIFQQSKYQTWSALCSVLSLSMLIICVLMFIGLARHLSHANLACLVAGSIMTALVSLVLVEQDVQPKTLKEGIQ